MCKPLAADVSPTGRSTAATTGASSSQVRLFSLYLELIPDDLTVFPIPEGAHASISLVVSSPRHWSAEPSSPPLRRSRERRRSPALVTSGQGEAKVAPDRASLLVNVQTRGATAASAAPRTRRRPAPFSMRWRSSALPREQLGTEGYSVYPELRYDKDGGSPKVTGYVVTNTVKAETHRVEQAGAMIDAALGAGANMINSLSFYAVVHRRPPARGHWAGGCECSRRR